MGKPANTVKTQTITDASGKPAFAVIPWDVWERVRPFAEGPSDEELFDVAMLSVTQVFPSEVVHAILDGKNSVKILREYRGLTQAALAKAAGISKLYISQIEAGRRKGSLETLRAVAKALKVDTDLVLPKR